MIYIFDLGGVLIKLNVNRCMHAFETLMGIENMRSVLGMDANGEGQTTSANGRPKDNTEAVSIAAKPLMAEFERGLIEPAAFVNEVLRFCKTGTTAEEVTDAWMSMLDELPQERLDFVDSIRAQGHRVYLLSNGNDLHFDFINEIYHLNQHFDRFYLSHKMHMAKPEKAIFEAVQQDIQKEHPECTRVLFIDDIAVNRKAAEQFVGWTTFPDIVSLI
jgi:putative hydrolase of the HAD superfamily